MIYRILFLSLLTFACLKDNILAQKNATEKTNEEKLQEIHAISKKFPDWGEKIGNDLIKTATKGRELLKHMQESVEGVKGKNATASKGMSDHLLVFHNLTVPLVDEMKKFSAEGREVLEIYKEFAHILNRD
ncbi:uncharacterized protein [Periplaneta americana]|uniref:uncharacterized protein n=1 Tax=Periplaneta americana TaxID=6978 RepID=UPI0037E8011F